MIEAIVISFIVGFAAVHVAFNLSPKRVQQKLCNVMVTGLKKIGLRAIAKRFVAIPQSTNKACGSGCGGCGIKAAGDESAVKLVQLHPRLK